MTSRMIEYTVDVIENNISEDIIPEVFLNRGITVDRNYIQGVLALQGDYLKIKQVLNDESFLRRFIKIMKGLALTDKIIKLPIPFNKFYLDFLRLTDYTLGQTSSYRISKIVNRLLNVDFSSLIAKYRESLPESMNYEIKEPIRTRVVKQLLQVDFYRIIMKYDYYFTNTLTYKLKSLENNPQQIIRLVKNNTKEYILFITPNKVVISDYKTEKTFELTQESEFGYLVLLTQSGKFLFPLEDSKDIYVIDFNTNETKKFSLEFNSQVSNMSNFGEDKIIVTTYDKIFILDSETFNVLNQMKTQTRPEGLVILLYPVKDNIQIVTLNDNEEETEISFWNPLRTEAVKVITIPHDPYKYQRSLHLFNNKVVAQYGSGLMLFMDLDGENMITVDQYDDPEALDDDNIMDIVVSDQLVVLFEGVIRYYDENGHITREIQTEDTKKIFKLPNGNILATNREGPQGFIRIYTEDGSYEYEINEEDSPNYYRQMIVSPTGKFIYLDNQTDLLVYK